NVFRAARRPVVQGPVRLALRAYDRAGSDAWAGLGSLVAVLDGDEIYRLRFDAIPFSANFTSGVVLDLARSHLGPAFYAYRLTRLEGGAAPFVSGREGALALA